MLRRLALFVLLVGIGFLALQACQPTKPVLLHGQTMGTTYNISYVEVANAPTPETLQQAIDSLLEQVNDQMSTYRPDSELSRFNALHAGLALPISAQTAQVVQTSIQLHQQSRGALDVTLGPLVNLWGFGPEAMPTTTPRVDVIQQALQITGMTGFALEGLQLRKLHDDLYLDLSAIAKGFGVDQVAELLESYGIAAYLVEIGGELKTKGQKADGQPWRIAIEQPSTEQRAVQLIIEPQDMAVATSGDYRNYYEVDGERFSHLIDPRTGYPIKHQLASVTVIDESCMIADGWATAMMVLGSEQALTLANEYGLAVMLIEKQGAEFQVRHSERFKELFL